MAVCIDDLPAGSPFYALREENGEIPIVTLEPGLVARLTLLRCDNLVLIGIQGESHMIVGGAFDAREIDTVIEQLRAYQAAAAKAEGLN